MQTLERAVGLIRSRRAVAAIMLVAGFAILSLSPAVAQAGHGRHHHRSADVTFTKWLVSLPADPTSFAGVLMAGVVGGDVGPGRYDGLVISDDLTSRPGFWLAHARYQFSGRDHSFVADLQITEDDTVVPYIGTIRGVVTRGWMRGARVTGQYRAWDVCPIPTPGNTFGATCYEGTLHLQRRHHRH